MKKPILTILSILCFCLVSWQPVEMNRETQSILSEATSKYHVLLDFEFESVDELNFMGSGIVEKADEILSDGIITIDDGETNMVGTNFSMNFNTGVYVRYKLDVNNT